MSTRATIILKREGWTACQLYHHFDGYECGVGKTLKTVFNKYDETKQIWLKETVPLLYNLEVLQPGREIEPADRNHSDIEFLYFIDLETSKITYFKGNKDELEETGTNWKDLPELTRDIIHQKELDGLLYWKKHQKGDE